jgi:hypothetical protein
VPHVPRQTRRELTDVRRGSRGESRADLGIEPTQLRVELRVLGFHRIEHREVVLVGDR